MNVKEYLATMKSIEENLLDFLEKSDNLETDFHQFTKIFADQHIKDEILKDFLKLISKISLNHQRTTYFIKKIENILTFLKKDILSKFTNSSLFNIFQNDKRILLFLFKNQFIKINDYVYNGLIEKKDFAEYFSPELIFYQTKESYDHSSFDEIREKGETNNHLCELIRNDSIKEFIVHINKTNLALNTKIQSTFFETNSFLHEKKDNMTLIEYAVFFGSIQIVRYLFQNNVDLNPSLWIFAIHSNNPELIHFLEENNVLPDDKTYQECLKESIKCFHNGIAHYIQDNLLQKSTQNDEDYLIECYNFEFCQNYLGNEEFLNYFIKYDYLLLIKIMMKDLDINKKMNDIYLLNNSYHTII